MNVHRFQTSPSIIVILVLGLCGTEDSPYCKDLISFLPPTITIITVTGPETSLNNPDQKLFMKNDLTRIVLAISLAKKICLKCPIIGIGMSIGGALLIQAKSLFHGIIVISTSIWYEHALTTMPTSLKGWVANRLLVWWQFWALFWVPNFLHNKTTLWEWLCLFFSRSMLDQDKIICKKYGIDYKTYIQSLDLRNVLFHFPNVHFLFSNNDPMFSEDHLKETKEVLKNTLIKGHFTDVGSHGEFTVTKRNDFLIGYVNGCLEELKNVFYN
jgi:hypothetical protein